MGYETIIWEQDGGVGTITLNRPDSLNAWTEQFGLDLGQVSEREASDESVRAVLITGAGRGFLRHFGAVMKSGDRKKNLPAVKAPTLVIHGSRDPMFPLRAGKAIATFVPNATWLPIAGMGHDMPPTLWPTIVSAVARHAERADSR